MHFGLLKKCENLICKWSIYQHSLSFYISLNLVSQILEHKLNLPIFFIKKYNNQLAFIYGQILKISSMAMCSLVGI
jgi:hypothetical protein